MEFSSTIKWIVILNIIILNFLSPTLFNSAQASSVNSYNLTIEDLEINNNTTIENKSILIKGNLTILSTGSYSLINCKIFFEDKKNSRPMFRVEPGGRLYLSNSEINGGRQNLSDTTFKILSSEIEITGCRFSNNYISLNLNYISNVTISQCIFSENTYGILLTGCNDIRFLNCTFIKNSQNACKLINSGRETEIKMINSSILHENSFKGNETVLLNSSLAFINVSYNDSIELDQASEVTIYWYLNLITLDKKNKKLDLVDISIYDGFDNFIDNYTTNEEGELYWIILAQKKIGDKNFNPYVLVASKKGYIQLKKDDLFIDINTSSPYIIKLSKSDKDSEPDYQQTIFTVCVCVIVIICVFLSLLAINMFIIRRRARSVGLDPLLFGEDKQKTDLMKGDIITCSECGAQVSPDEKFCPHCGDYFEGEEFECPGCNTLVSEKAKSCPKCGKTFETEEKELSKASKSTKPSGTSVISSGEKEKLFCSECGAVIIDKDKRCPGCGLILRDKARMGDKDTKYAFKVTAAEEAKLRKIEKSSNLNGDTYMCSMCGASIKEDTVKCPKCGIEFE